MIIFNNFSTKKRDPIAIFPRFILILILPTIKTMTRFEIKIKND